MKLIKRYGNRKFYDTTLHQYIKLENIREYVKNNVSFQVMSVKGQCDITQQVIFDSFVPVLRGKLTSEVLKSLSN